MGAPTCPRCGIGLMFFTEISPAPGRYEHRCAHCGYIEHLWERHMAPQKPADTQPAEGATTRLDETAELTGELLTTAEGDEPTISLGGAYVSIPPEALPPGTTVTLTVTYTLTIAPSKAS